MILGRGSIEEARREDRRREARPWSLGLIVRPRVIGGAIIKYVAHNY